MNTANDVVITGLGLVSGAGTGADAQMDLITGKIARSERSLESFRAAAHLSDKRMMKAISHSDSIGLAAVELLRKDAGWDTVKVVPERIGMYVGAPPAGASDNAYYMDAQKAADGSLKAFGKTCMDAKPTTLLIGLPNNVLCYGAMVLDARGPNDNYTSSALSGLIAVMNAARRLTRGQLDVAVAGGFCAYHSDPVNKGVLAASGLPEAEVADGAAFVTLERRDGAKARGATVHATIAGYAQGSDAMGCWAFDPAGAALEHMVKLAMAQACLKVSDVALVLLAETGIDAVDAAERGVIDRIFRDEAPALGAFARIFGNLAEAGGVMELGLAAKVAALGDVPPSLRVTGGATKIDQAKKGFLVLRSSLSGGYACVALTKEQE